MTLVEDRVYDFQLAVHWAAGARHDLRLAGDRLVVPAELAIEPLPGTGPSDARALPSIDPRGRLFWLRPRSRELRRLSPDSRWIAELGTLPGQGPARRLVVGHTISWVLAEERLDRYDAATLQRLSPAAQHEGWRVRDLAGDGVDGLWVAEVSPSGRWRLRHVDCWGRTCRDTIAVPGFHGGELSVAATADGAWLVVLDPIESAVATVFDAAGGETGRDIAIDPVHRGQTTLVSMPHADRLHLLTPIADACAYQVVNLTDEDVEEDHRLRLPARLGRPVALAGHVVSGTRGMARIVAREGESAPRRSTFITPTLVSPVDVRSGWNRAEIDVSLPTGTAVEATWASTDDPWLVDRAERLLGSPATAARVVELDGLLPWRNEKKVVYRSAGGSAVEQLAVLLDDVKETTLWLRIQLHTPPGRTPPELTGLRVRYPAVSYLDHLPAIYREDQRGAADLRRILAPYEMLFDGLDNVLADLPRRIDPDTAGDDWTDYLLSWLGFPPLGDLPAPLRRALLKRAPEILDQRGTKAGLETVLDVVTEGRAVVTDAAEQPVAWFLGPGNPAAAGAAPARLGRDTMVLAQRLVPARAGTMVVGRSPLGVDCPDPGLMLAQRAGVVTIQLELGPERELALRSIIDRLIRVFVPAHCRVRVVYTGADTASRTRELDVDFRLGPDPAADDPTPYDALLYSDAHWRLGATTRLGRWSLPEPELSPAVLDHGPLLDAGRRLH